MTTKPSSMNCLPQKSQKLRFLACSQIPQYERESWGAREIFSCAASDVLQSLASDGSSRSHRNGSSVSCLPTIHRLVEIPPIWLAETHFLASKMPCCSGGTNLFRPCQISSSTSGYMRPMRLHMCTRGYCRPAASKWCSIFATINCGSTKTSLLCCFGGRAMLFQCGEHYVP